MKYIEYRKYDGSPHYRFAVTAITMGERDAWVWSRAGVELFKGATHVGALPHAALHHIAVGRNHQLTWVFARRPDGVLDLAELYVNITTVHEALASPMVDLDLDVVAKPGAAAEVVDRDEFAAHRLAMHYPAQLCDQAEQTAAAIAAKLERQQDLLEAVPPQVMARFQGAASAAAP